MADLRVNLFGKQLAGPVTVCKDGPVFNSQEVFD